MVQTTISETIASASQASNVPSTSADEILVRGINTGSPWIPTFRSQCLACLTSSNGRRSTSPSTLSRKNSLNSEESLHFLNRSQSLICWNKQGGIHFEQIKSIGKR